MIELSNLRKEQAGDWTRLVCDFTWCGETPPPFTEKTIWFSVKNENADFFSTKVYDPFLLVPYYVAMYYRQDLKICGKVSPKLYHNLTNYIQRIYLDFSDKLHPVKLEVEGFDTVEQSGALVGAGFSCGVDSLSTVYDHFVKETVPGYKINALFLFNCGGNGYIEKESTRILYQARYERNKKAADELGLPLYQVESNLHAFTASLGAGAIYKLTYLSNWSCAISVQNRIKKYYVASCFSYEDISGFHQSYHDKDIDEFCGTYLVPLIQTEKLELIYDGAQYRRTQKTENIADWELAQRHLSVCLTEKEPAENCGCCQKCLRTLSALDSLGKLEEFSAVFDIEKYKRFRLKNNCTMIYEMKTNTYSKDNIEFAREHHKKLPPVWFAHTYMAVKNLWGTICPVVVRLTGKETAQRIKEKAQGALTGVMGDA